MAELDPLIAEILLKGDDEFLGSLKKVGTEAANSFKEVAKAAEEGAGGFKTLTGVLGLTLAAISGTTAATIAFVDAQTELSQATLLLADAFGSTGEQLQNIEQVFASSGVKVEQFERFAVRLTGTIAREWPAITEAIKTYATENDAAQERVTNATLRVQDAQKALADHSDERASQMVRDNQAVEASAIQLQFANQKALQEQIGATQAVASARLNETAALQKLAELEGRPPSEADKQALALAQAREAVDAAHKATQDALIAQQEKAASAALNRAKQEQEYNDLSRKAAQNARDDAEQRVKDENAIKDAITAKAEASDKADKLALTSPVSIRAALEGIVSGNKDAAKQIDLNAVSVENLKKGIIALAGETSKITPPTGFEALRTLARTFEADTDKLINPQQRLRLVTELAGSAMQSLGKSAAETLAVLENGSAKFDAIANRAKEFDSSIDDSRHVIEEYRGALNEFELTVSQLSQAFAAAVAPAFTAFLQTLNEWFLAIKKSANDSGGVIHEFWNGLKELGSAISTVVSVGGQLLDWFAKAASHDVIGAMDIFKAAIIGVGVALVIATGPLGVWVTALGLIVIAIGAIVDHAPEIGAVFSKVWDAVKDTTVVKFFEGILYVVDRIVKGIGIIFGAAKTAPAQTLGNTPVVGAVDNAAEAPISRASGGPINGPGSGTSDSILARLSNGEFVMRAAAVQSFGMDFMHAINNGFVPGFASGGLVASPTRMAGGVNNQATGVLNLTIGDRTFSGLRGAQSTIDDLSSFAISRQTSAAGSNPSWMK